MTRARSQLIDLNSTSYYHCISRCVRRAFLWGEDHFTGKNYSHRKQWVIDRLTELNTIYAIDICAYAIMSNHYHLVLRVNANEADNWPESEIIERWSKLFNLPLLVKRYQGGKTSAAENIEALKLIKSWRERLHDISWFMRSLNEYLARKANREDNCKGRFWEGRFKSQALLDEKALLTCMSYVDLNPIRAGIAVTPEESDFTSIQQRIHQWRAQTTQEKGKHSTPGIMALKPMSQTHIHKIEFEAIDYLQLVDWAGRAIREGKRGYIPANVPPILARLNIEPQAYLKQLHSTKNRLSLPVALGSAKALLEFANRHGRKFLRNVKTFQACT